MNDNTPTPDFRTWFRSLSDLEQERVLRHLRTAAEAILLDHAQRALAQPVQPPKRNVQSLN